MKKNTFFALTLIFLSQFYLESCYSKTDSFSNTVTALTNDSTQVVNKNLGMILLFSDNVTQVKKDSVIDKLKSLNVKFLDSRNNSNLILLQFGTNEPVLTIDPKIGTITNNLQSKGYEIASISVDQCTCNVCNPDDGYGFQVGMIDEVSSINLDRFHNTDGMNFNQNPQKAEFTNEVMLRDRIGKYAACSAKCCCCPNLAVRTILYSKPVRNNKLDLFNYLDAIYWAKNRKINVLINQFSYVQTNEVKALLTRVLADIKSSNLKIISIDDTQIEDINGLIKASQDLIFSDNINLPSPAKRTFKK